MLQICLQNKLANIFMKKITEARMTINYSGNQPALELAHTRVDVKLLYALAETPCKLQLYITSWAYPHIEGDFAIKHREVIPWQSKRAQNS